MRLPPKDRVMYIFIKATKQLAFLHETKVLKKKPKKKKSLLLVSTSFIAITSEKNVKKLINYGKGLLTPWSIPQLSFRTDSIYIGT